MRIRIHSPDDNIPTYVSVERVPAGAAGGAEGQHARLHGGEDEAGENFHQQQSQLAGGQDTLI